MRHLPQELIENILDGVRYECDLYSCSLVSRAWLPRTRHRLFSTIKLYFIEYDDPLEKLHRRLAQLVDPDATFIPFVQRLDLYFKILTYGWEEPFAAFTRVLPRYTSLVAINIGRWQSSELDSKLHPLLDMLTHTPKLSSLVLGGGDVDEAADIFRILNACPMLTVLVIQNKFYWPNATPASLDSTAYPRAGAIHALRLEGRRMTDILDGFLAAGVPLACTTVDLRNIPADSVPSIGQFLACLGDNLRFLSIGLEWTYTTNYDESKVGRPDVLVVTKLFIEHVDLRKNTCLEAFRLCNIAYRYDCITPGPAVPLPNIPCILCSLPSSLVDISLTFELFQLDEVLLLPWEEIDVTLATKTPRQFTLFVVPRLTYITGENCNVADDKMRAAIREGLPRLDAMGMLKLPPGRLNYYSLPDWGVDGF